MMGHEGSPKSARALPDTSPSLGRHRRLRLRAGDLVEVRPLREILGTLDEKGRLDGLPFMPEMMRFCGKRFRVGKSAHKTCDRVHKSGLRRMEDTVHLEDLRCDGASHGGCEASCLIFWKEAWLVRAPEHEGAEPPRRAERATDEAAPEIQAGLESLQAATRSTPDASAASEVRWSCQATEMFGATTSLPWWDLRQYVKDVRTGNATTKQVLRWLVIRSLNQIQRIPRTYRIIETLRGGLSYPRIQGTLTKTPRGVLGLEPGERVRIKPAAEIRATLDTRGRNRGLSFDTEMVRYCGQEHRVHSRVTRLIDEPTGRMMELANDCIILDGVVCTAEYHGLCPRAIYPFWRELWMERAGAASPPGGAHRGPAASAALQGAELAAAQTSGRDADVGEGGCGRDRGKENGDGED